MIASASRVWLGSAAGTAKTRAGRARLPARSAEEASAGGRLRGLRSCCDWTLRIRRNRPNQRDDPADEGLAGKNVQDENGGEVGFVPRQKGREKIQE